MNQRNTVRAYASIGSHGGIYVFEAGPVADRYPDLLEIYRYPRPGLIPVTITYPIKIRVKQR